MNKYKIIQIKKVIMMNKKIQKMTMKIKAIHIHIMKNIILNIILEKKIKFSTITIIKNSK